MSSHSIVLNLRDERAREASHNNRTALDHRRPVLQLDAKRVFIERYATIKAALKRHRRQGVLMLAFDAQREAVGEAWLEASLDRSRALIVGRHSSCGLVIPHLNETVSLRHLCVVVRAIAHDDVRIRVVDLHSGTGFGDEQGRRLESVTADGSLFLALNDVRIVVLQTGPDVVIPDDAEIAYACIPARVYLDERDFAKRGSMLPPVRHVDGQTMERLQRGPLNATAKLLERGEVPFVRLTLAGAELSVTREVSRDALERGILVGRYSRCDVRTGQDSDAISRIHLLLTLDGDEVLAVDAGSSNGSYIAGRSFRAATLADGVLVNLGQGDDLELRVERA